MAVEYDQAGVNYDQSGYDYDEAIGASSTHATSLTLVGRFTSAPVVSPAGGITSVTTALTAADFHFRHLIAEDGRHLVTEDTDDDHLILETP